MSVIVFVFLVRRMALPTDLASGECRRMDIGIGSVREQGVHQRAKVVSRNVLRRDRQNIGLCPCACHGATIRRARRGARGAVAQVRAEEHEDGAGRVRLAEMDMGLCYRTGGDWRRADVRIGQLIGDERGGDKRLPPHWRTPRSALARWLAFAR
jgi:hypothetical protein